MFAWLTHLISPTVWCVVCAKFGANELMVSFALFCVICDICIVARFLVMVQYLCCFHWEAHDDLVVDLIRLHAVRFRFWDLFIWNLWISWRFAVIWFAVCYLSCSVRYNHCWSCVWFVVCDWKQWCSLNTIRILCRSSAIAANTWVSLKLVHNWRIDSIDDCNNLPLMNVDSVLFVSFWFGCSVALVALCGDCTVIRCPSDHTMVCCRWLLCSTDVCRCLLSSRWGLIALRIASDPPNLSYLL